MRRSSRIGAVAAVLAAGMAMLAGCSAATPATTTAPTTAVVPTTPAATVTVTATPSPTDTQASGGKGCTNSTPMPADVDSARIGDIDGDGKPDTEFYSDAPTGAGQFGIHTAAGGVYLVNDGLAGPATHSGWTAGLDASPGFVTVLDDDRSANLFVFHDCSWVRTKGVDGKPYVFGLAGFYTAGTGVACNDRNGGVLLEGVLAKKRSNGRFDILWTQIDVSADGTLARNGATETRWSDLPASDPRVQASMESHCGDAPKVHTNGE